MFVQEKKSKIEKKKKKKGVLILHLKKHVFSTSILETSWWLVLYDWFPTKFVFTYNTSLVWWNKRRSKVQENMSCEHTLNFDQWKTINQWEFDYGLFTNLPRIIVAPTFLRVHSNPKEVLYLPWQNTILTWKLLVISS